MLHKIKMSSEHVILSPRTHPQFRYKHNRLGLGDSQSYKRQSQEEAEEELKSNNCPKQNNTQQRGCETDDGILFTGFVL